MEKRITRLIRIPESTYDRIWDIHTKTRSSINSIILDLIEKGLESKEKRD